MKLLRVQVPDFRVLKNVDISFEKDFVPNIFPLGSQNGGGKSTLLQLIFVLLHCSGDSNRHEFIKNMLYGFKIDDNSHKRVLAIFDVWDGQRKVHLEFVAYKDSYARELLTSKDNSDTQYDSEYLLFSASTKLENVKDKIATTQQEIDKLEKIVNRLENLKKIENRDERLFRFRDLREELKYFGFTKYTARISRFIEEISIEELQEEIKERLDISKLNITNYDEEREEIKNSLQKIFNFLRYEKMVYISSYSTSIENKEEKVLVCHIDNINIDIANDFLNDLSQNVFLAAPATQVFLFLTKDSRNLLFKQQNHENTNNYYSELKLTKSKLFGFFTYDFLAVDLLLQVFKSARDKDFTQAIETGEYGNNYQQLVNDLNLLLLNKKININADLSGFTFKLDMDDKEIELSPEDLSHGELKRLSIYTWIKYNIIENAIVLIDEIENAFHPDWQYQIIKDIGEWSPNNQYIIATHSYELCQAVTPAHVKELEPRLIKQESES